MYIHGASDDKRVQPIDDRSHAVAQMAQCGEIPFTGAACNRECAISLKEAKHIWKVLFIAPLKRYTKGIGTLFK